MRGVRSARYSLLVLAGVFVVLWAVFIALTGDGSEHVERSLTSDREDVLSGPKLATPGGDQPGQLGASHPEGPSVETRPAPAVPAERWFRIVYDGTTTGVSGATVGLNGVWAARESGTYGLVGFPEEEASGEMRVQVSDAWAESLGLAPRFGPLSGRRVVRGGAFGTRLAPHEVHVSPRTTLGRFEGVVVSASGSLIPRAWVHVIGRRDDETWNYGSHAATQATPAGRFSIQFALLPRNSESIELVAVVGAAGFHPRVVAVSDTSHSRIALATEDARTVIRLEIETDIEAKSPYRGVVLLEEDQLSPTLPAIADPAEGQHLGCWVVLTQRATGVSDVRDWAAPRIKGDQEAATYMVRDLRTFRQDVARGSTVRVRFLRGDETFVGRATLGAREGVRRITLHRVPTFGITGKLQMSAEAHRRGQLEDMRAVYIYVRGWRSVYPDSVDAGGRFEFLGLSGGRVELVAFKPGTVPLIVSISGKLTGSHTVALPGLPGVELVYEVAERNAGR